MRPEQHPVPVLPSTRGWALHDVPASRRIEQAAQLGQAPNSLMQRAGLAVARLALALAPHARSIWIAAGPGNNGGDGLVAARHLHLARRSLRVSLLGDPSALAADAQQAHSQALQAGVSIEATLPNSMDFDLAIDALLGIGANRAPQGHIAQAIGMLNDGIAPVLAVDVPSGLDASNGGLLGSAAVRASHTLSLLTLKPGLFTAQGRDHSGRVWFDSLGVDSRSELASATLIGPPPLTARAHAQHKGSFGDVLVVGGAAGMSGAAMLAARAALAAGAGRVFLVRLDGCLAPDPLWPEIMPRPATEVLQPQVLAQRSVVCGCGGGDAVRAVLPMVLHHSARLVLDADALNAIASEPSLLRALQSRASRGLPSLATPHPLEAARLLGIDSAQVQADRLVHATALAGRLQCNVVLKGSGTVIACPDQVPAINSTGNARLGTAGTGDVLAGWIGGLWAQHPLDAASDIAAAGVWLHGRAGEGGDLSQALRAAELIEAMARLRPG